MTNALRRAFLSIAQDTRFTPFTPLPKEVVVTAVDVAGQPHEVTVPWEGQGS